MIYLQGWFRGARSRFEMALTCDRSYFDQQVVKMEGLLYEMSRTTHARKSRVLKKL